MAPRREKHNKRDAILQAMLEIVAERGFHDAPMSLLAERSGASAGVIYHHFQSKDELIQALYRRVAALKYEHLFEGVSVEMEPREIFLRLWSNVYGFARRFDKEARFMEKFLAAGFPCEAVLPPDDARMQLFQRHFVGRSRGGVLNELPAPVLEEMSVGLATRLAALPLTLSGEEQREIAEHLWVAVTT